MIALCQKKTIQKTFCPIQNIFMAVCGDDLEQNLGTIHASNPEHLPFLNAPRGDHLEQNAGTIHTSNPEHLLVFKAPHRVDPCVHW